MNYPIQYTHLGDTVSFYQVAQTSDHPSLNDQVVNFKGHSLKKIVQPNQILNCMSCNTSLTTQRRNTDSILRCVQPNCYFGITEKELTTQQSSNDTPDTQQGQLASKMANEAFVYSEFAIQQLMSDTLLKIMPVHGFDGKDPKLTKSEIAKNIQIQANITLNEEYVNSLSCNTTTHTQPCPYLNSIFNKNMRAVHNIVSAPGMEIIKQLITDIMKQQNININMRDSGNHCVLFGHIVGSTIHLKDLEYDLNPYMIGHYTTAFEALSELIKEVEFDTILIKLSRVYPQAFDRNSNVFIDTWDWSKQIITFGYKKPPVANNIYGYNNQSYKPTEISIGTFCPLEDMIFNFDLLKDALDNTPNLSYDKLFEVSTFSSFGRPSGEQSAPRGQLSPDIFVRLPI
jgi:hypothetical protein